MSGFTAILVLAVLSLQAAQVPEGKADSPATGVELEPLKSPYARPGKRAATTTTATDQVARKPVEQTSTDRQATTSRRAAPAPAQPKSKPEPKAKNSPVQNPPRSEANPTPAPATKEAAEAGPEISSIRISGVEPARPIAGELAQVRLEIGVSDQGTPDDATLREFLSSNLATRAEDYAVHIPADGFEILSSDLQPGGAVKLVANATFRWPVGEKRVLEADHVQPLLVRTSEGRASRMLVIVTTKGFLTWPLIVLLITGIALPLGYLAWRRLRRAAYRVEDLSFTTDAITAEPSPYFAGDVSSGGHSPDPVTPPSQPLHDAVQAAPIEVPEDLAEAVAEGAAVLVLGAGASIAGGVPASNALLLELIERYALTLPSPLSNVPEAAHPLQELDAITRRLGGFSKAMEVIAASLPRDELIAGMTSILWSSGAGGQLFGQLRKCSWAAVVSLTLDQLAEQAFSQPADDGLPGMRAVTITDAPDLASSSRATGERFLFQAFGDLDRAPTVAFTVEEMRRNFQRAPAFQRALAGLFQTRPFLFLGADSNTIEQFVQSVSPEFEGVGPHHYALVARDPVNDLIQTSLSRFGLSLLEYEPGSEAAALSDFAHELRLKARSAAASRSPGAAGSSILSPARVTRIGLENIGPFDRLDLHLAEGDEDEEKSGKGVSHWSVIFGGNGVGKSTILKAAALALAGDFPPLAGAGNRLLKVGTSEGTIEVEMGNQILKTRLVRDRSSVLVTSLQQTPLASGNALVLGFPALRGARTPDSAGPSSKPDIRDPDPKDLVALVNGEVDSRLADFKQWLVNTMVLESRGDGRSATMLKLLNAIIREMVPGQIDAFAPLAPNDFIIRVITPEGEIPFDDLSQGMSSIFNWIGLLSQRLFSICEGSPDPSGEPAIVLIDEIDAHLHPEWQRRLADLTRRFFPNVQVIATSHSPLLAGALKASELVVLERDPDTNEVVQAEHVPDPYGLPSQDILTSGVFGLTTDRNPEVEILIADYFAVFQKHERSDEEEQELKDLGTKLEKFRYGGDPIPSVEPPALSESDIALINARFGDPEGKPA
jgi:hypothetical protein